MQDLQTHAQPQPLPLSRLQQQVQTARDQLLQLDLSPIAAAPVAQGRRHLKAAKHVMQTPLYA